MNDSAADIHDRELLARVAQKDQQAFSELYDRYSTPVFSFVCRIVNNQKEAEEILQDAFLQVWNKAGSFLPGHGRPLSWLLTVARNRAVDALRARQRHQQRFQEPATAAGSELDSPSDQAPAPHQLFAAQEDRSRIDLALQTLPPDQRQAIELAFFSGLTQLEISQKLDQPLGTVKARIRRGLLKLRELLENTNSPSTASAPRVNYLQAS